MECPICKKYFEEFLGNDLQVHVNLCLDKQNISLPTKNEDIHPLINILKGRKKKKDCPICFCKNASALHLKKCAKENNINPKSLVKLCENNDTKLDEQINKIKIDDQDFSHRSLYFKNDKVENNFLEEVEVVLNQKTQKLNKPTKTKQTKLKVKKILIPDSQTQNEINSDGSQNYTVLKKEICLKKIKKNPLKKILTENRIIKNFKNEFTTDDNMPIVWKMATLLEETTKYIVHGFEPFCLKNNFKSELRGF